MSSKKIYIGNLSQTRFTTRAIFKKYILNENGTKRAGVFKIGKSTHIISGAPSVLETLTNPSDFTDQEIGLTLSIGTSPNTFTARTEMTGLTVNLSEQFPEGLTKINNSNNFDNRYEVVDVLNTDNNDYKIIVLGNPETNEIFFARAYNLNTKLFDLGEVVICTIKLSKTSYRIEKQTIEKYQRELLKVYKQQEEYAIVNKETGELETKAAYKYDTVLDIEKIEKI